MRLIALTVACLVGIAGVLLIGYQQEIFCHPSVYARLRLPGPTSKCFPEPVEPMVRADEFPGMIRVGSEEDIEIRRRGLVNFVWRTPDLPTDRLPTRVLTGVTEPGFAGIANLKRIDILETELPHGFVSRVYHFLPDEESGRLAIYYEGHTGSFVDLARDIIESAIAQGHSVMAVDLPMDGVNDWPERLDLPDVGRIAFGGSSHWDLALLESEDFAPIELFLDPVLRAVNHAQSTDHYTRIFMLGVSGGGWATTVYAALDPRIERSYPVAGSLPFSMHRRHPVSGKDHSFGDYEQRVTGLYRIATYLDLYVMGAAGTNRRQLQILNKYDQCCFFGTEAKLYEPAVQAAVARIGAGGSFEVAIDDTHVEHDLSSHALDLILHDADELDPEPAIADTASAAPDNADDGLDREDWAPYREPNTPRAQRTGVRRKDASGADLGLMARLAHMRADGRAARGRVARTRRPWPAPGRGQALRR